VYRDKLSELVYDHSYIGKFQKSNKRYDVKAQIFFVDETKISSEQIKKFFQNLYSFLGKDGIDFEQVPVH
jgi:aspartate oxidase